METIHQRYLSNITLLGKPYFKSFFGKIYFENFALKKFALKILAIMEQNPFRSCFVWLSFILAFFSNLLGSNLINAVIPGTFLIVMNKIVCFLSVIILPYLRKRTYKLYLTQNNTIDWIVQIISYFNPNVMSNCF